MECWFQTDKGKVRELNEDAVNIFANDNVVLAIVADGMGGHQAGDVASKLAVNNLGDYWSELTNQLEVDSLKDWLKTTIQKVNHLIYDQSQANHAYQGMGTTIVAAICLKETLIIGHVGDSRAYLMNPSEYKQVTDDHSLVGELVRTGQLSEEDAQVHPKRNIILKALGTESEIEPDIYHIAWQEDETLLLCSDGLSNKVSDEEMHEIVMNTPDEEVSEKLVQLANDRGGEDNITLAIVKNDAEGEVGEPSC